MAALLFVATLTCAVPASPALVALQQDAVQAQRWNWGWGSVFLLNGAAQLSAGALGRERGFRIDRYVGGAASLVGALSVGLAGPRAARELRRLGPCPREDEVAQALARVARQQRFARRGFQHALAAGFNLGLGVLLGLRFGRWVSAGLQVVLGTAVAEAAIWTRPSRVMRLSPVVQPQRGGLALTFAYSH